LPQGFILSLKIADIKYLCKSFNTGKAILCSSMVTQHTHLLSVLIIMDCFFLAIKNRYRRMCYLRNC